MKIIKTKIKDLVLLKTERYDDNRGYFREVFIEKIIKKKFVFDCTSFSKKGVLRGLHYQKKFPQGKLLTVVKVEIFDVAVDLRSKSKTYGEYFAIKISDKSNFSLYIPPGMAHGFLCLSSQCNIYYKCTNYRHLKSEKVILWNDKFLNIKWPRIKKILSKKDSKGESLNLNKL